jgi:hypothetical protein
MQGAVKQPLFPAYFGPSNFGGRDGFGSRHLDLILTGASHTGQIQPTGLRLNVQGSYLAWFGFVTLILIYSIARLIDVHCCLSSN